MRELFGHALPIYGEFVKRYGAAVEKQLVVEFYVSPLFVCMDVAEKSMYRYLKISLRCVVDAFAAFASSKQ